MHAKPLHRTIILVTILLLFVVPGFFGQKKASTEIDITKKWSYSLTEAPIAIAHYPDELFVGLGNGKVESLSLDGKKIWSSEFGGNISSDLVALDNGLFFANTLVSSDTAKPAGGKLRSVSRDTGITNWTVPLPEAEHYFLCAFNGSIVIVSGNGVVESVDARTGSMKWTRQIAETFVANPSVTATVVTLATGKQIFSISLAAGEILSMRKVPFDVTALAEGDGALIVGDQRGNLAYYENGADKAAWTFKSGGQISDIVLTGDGVLAGSHDNFIYFISGKNGSRLWKKRLAGRMPNVASIVGQYVLVAAVGDQRLEIIELSTGKVAGQVTFEDDEDLVARPLIDSNGNLFLLTNNAAYDYSSTSFVKK
jgi:outer membrane protein assembly factor BamB